MAGPGGRMMAGAGPDQRSMDFVGSGKRLIGRFRPERVTIWALLACVVVSVGLSVIGPKILGKATDLVFGGIVGRDLPAGATKEQVLESMRARGEDRIADMLRGKGLNADHRHEVSSDQDLMALLEANIGIGFLPRTVNAPASLVRASVEGIEFDRAVCLYGVAGRQRTPIAATFMKMLRAAKWPKREG